MSEARYEKKDWLEEQYSEKTIREIAQICDVSRQTIWKRLKKFEIERRASHPRKEETEVECDQCGRKFTKPSYNVNEHNFCSQDCLKEWMTGSNNPAWKGGNVEVECSECGKVFEKMRCESDRKIHFCSDECESEWKSKHLRGENNPNWEGGTASHPVRKTKAYQEWREAVFERDDYICQECGKRTNRRLQAHHIIPISEDPSKALDIENGVTLCVAHHNEKHPNIPIHDFSLNS